MTSKYTPLARHLRVIQGNDWTASFRELEEILGFKLPASARKYQAWWAHENAPETHVQKLAWMSVGWTVDTVSIAGEQVQFRRFRRTV